MTIENAQREAIENAVLNGDLTPEQGEQELELLEQL